MYLESCIHVIYISYIFNAPPPLLFIIMFVCMDIAINNSNINGDILKFSKMKYNFTSRLVSPIYRFLLYIFINDALYFHQYLYIYVDIYCYIMLYMKEKHILLLKKRNFHMDVNSFLEVVFIYQCKIYDIFET